MKALTIHQPYASLIAAGAKSFETRSWEPSDAQLAIGDLLAIHAGVGGHPDPYYNPSVVCAMRSARLLPQGHDYPWVKDRDRILPLGSVVAVVRFLGAWSTSDALIMDHEMPLGDYSEGRFAWSLKLVVQLPEPIPAKGAQRLWNWTPPAPISGICRICGCSEQYACDIQDGLDSCSWVDEARTLCSAPTCASAVAVP